MYICNYCYLIPGHWHKWSCSYHISLSYIERVQIQFVSYIFVLVNKNLHHMMTRPINLDIIQISWQLIWILESIVIIVFNLQLFYLHIYIYPHIHLHTHIYTPGMIYYETKEAHTSRGSIVQQFLFSQWKTILVFFSVKNIRT